MVDQKRGGGLMTAGKLGKRISRYSKKTAAYQRKRNNTAMSKRECRRLVLSLIHI